MIKELVYLGTPYTGTNEEKEYRTKVVDYISQKLANDGVIVYSPISSWHNIAKRYNLPTDYSFWQDMCETFLSKCSKLIVVMLPGWDDSKGLTGEIIFAIKNNIKIEYIEPFDIINEVHANLI